MSGRRAAAAIFGLLSIIPVCAPAQGVLIESILLPPRFYVGDYVELRLKYQLPANLAVREPRQLPEDSWIEIRGIEVQDRRSPGSPGEVRVRLFFTPFRPGKKVLPLIQAGGLDLGEIEIVTQSTLEGEEDQVLRGPRRQLYLPLTWIKVLSAGAAAIGIPLVVFMALFYGLRGLARIREARRRRLPYQHVRKRLQQLSAQYKSMGGRSFFILLSLALKRYLTEKLALSLMSTTTGEIAQELAGAGLEQDLALSIHALFKQADLIKFSANVSNAGEMRKTLSEADRIVEKIERKTFSVEP
jgi:hypothetical protein